MRRWLILLWIAVLIVPGLDLFAKADQRSLSEGRLLAQPPALPDSLEDVAAFPRATDAFIRDQFGYRRKMIATNTSIRRFLGEESTRETVVRGRDDFLLLREGLTRSFGIEKSRRRADHTAGLVCAIQQRLAARNVQFIYAVAPSPTTIYPEVAPEWLGAPQTPTNYDLVLAAVQRCHGDALDLRPVLLAQKGAYQLYRRTDTHWTPRAAIMAYNAIVARLDRPELALASNQVSWITQRAVGDLVRISGDFSAPREIVESPVIESPAATHQQVLPTRTDDEGAQTYLRDYAHDGPSVLIIGDSYAGSFFPQYLARVSRRVSFIYHRHCRFNWRHVEEAAPDIVIFMPAERHVACAVGLEPENFETAPP
jgi:alginate O-acetyltransferase complex protein AlgJ